MRRGDEGVKERQRETWPLLWLVVVRVRERERERESAQVRGGKERERGKETAKG